MEHKESKLYISPAIEIYKVTVEYGFIGSVPGSSEGTGEDEW